MEGDRRSYLKSRLRRPLPPPLRLLRLVSLDRDLVLDLSLLVLDRDLE